ALQRPVHQFAGAQRQDQSQVSGFQRAGEDAKVQGVGELIEHVQQRTVGQLGFGGGSGTCQRNDHRDVVGRGGQAQRLGADGDLLGRVAVPGLQFVQGGSARRVEQFAVVASGN